MKVKELVTSIHDNKFNLEVKKYLPIEEKKITAMAIIAMCTDEIDGFVTVDRIKLRVYYVMTVLSSYTGIEVSSDFNDLVEEYDLLCESGLLNKIINLIGDDYNICYDIVQDELNSMLVENSIEMQVVKVANKINGLLDIIGNKLSDIDFNTILPEGTDVNKLIDMLKQLE